MDTLIHVLQMPLYYSNSTSSSHHRDLLFFPTRRSSDLPNFLPAASMSMASFSRRIFVSSRLAESIQPMYLRRCDGASFSKKLQDRKSTRLNSSHLVISYAVFCLKKKIKELIHVTLTYST